MARSPVPLPGLFLGAEPLIGPRSGVGRYSAHLYRGLLRRGLFEPLRLVANERWVPAEEVEPTQPGTSPDRGGGDAAATPRPAGQLRLRIVDERQLNPASIMPGFYRDPRLANRVASAFRGKTFMSAQQVEDVVAYLETLK